MHTLCDFPVAFSEDYVLLYSSIIATIIVYIKLQHDSVGQTVQCLWDRCTIFLYSYEIGWSDYTWYYYRYCCSGSTFDIPLGMIPTRIVFFIVIIIIWINIWYCPKYVLYYYFHTSPLRDDWLLVVRDRNDGEYRSSRIITIL